MPEFDAYCALCGACAAIPYYPDDDEKGHYYDPKVITRDDMQWMDDLRVIGFNPESRSRSKVFVTGKAKYDDYGFCDAEPGDDPNVPTPDQAEYGSRKLNIRTYDQGEETPLSYPFHDACYQVFGHVIAFTEQSGSTERAEVDHELMYQSFKSLDGGEYHMSLELDHWNMLRNYHDQNAPADRGDELIGFDPHNLPKLEHELLPLLPIINLGELAAIESEKPLRVFDFPPSSRGAGRFGDLPPEIMLKIFAYLDVTSMNSFRATSQAIAQIRFSNAFWKQRVHRDLPWLYGIELKAQRKTTLDWKGVHKMLRVIADPDDQRTNHRLPNRERVWGTCEQIANVYWAKLSERTAREAKTKLSSAGTLVSGYMPACADVSTRRTYREHPFELQAITDWMDIGAYSLHIATRWNDNGHLASLRTELHRGDMAPWNQDSAVDPSLQQEGNQQMLVVPRGKWVASITTIIGISGGCRATVGLIFELRPEGKVVVGNTNGDKRVLEVAEGNVFVGLRGEALDDLVVRLGVLEGKPPDSARNVSPFLAEEGAQNIALQRYVWAREIFPPQVMPRRPSFSSLVEDAEKSDLVTMDALLLGTTEEELEALTGISGDALLWGFAAHYSDRPSRKAGQHCHAMKHFAVSGAQGERVVAMDTSGHQLLGSISLKTNWSRQCVFGIAPRGRNSGPEQVPAADHFFAGFFGSWSYLPRGGKPNEMSSCSMLSCPTEREPRSVRQAGKTWALDGEGRFWDGNGPSLFDTRYPFAYYTEECGSPNEDSDSEAAEIEAARAVYHARWRKNQAEEDPRLPIAMEWRPSGPIYGNNPDNVQADTGVNHWMPTNAKIASVLDCSKAISKVEVWYTHPQRVAVPQYQRRDNPDMIVPQCAEVQFVSVILRLSDGSTTAFGPTEFDEMYKHHEGHEPLCDCWVSYEGEPESRRQPEKKLPFKLHYHSEEWTVGGQTLAQLWVWSSVFCDGLQFVAANGEESPLFGICDGEPSGVIEFGEGKAVGLKVLSDANHRSVTKQDVVLMGLQAMTADT